MSKAAPTNTDVIRAVMTVSADLATLKSEVEIQHKEKMVELAALTEQVKYTNGQVRELKQWRSNQEAVENYRKSIEPQPPMVRVNNNLQWDWKTVLAILLTLATIFAGVLTATGVSK